MVSGGCCTGADPLNATGLLRGFVLGLETDQLLRDATRRECRRPLSRMVNRRPPGARVVIYYRGNSKMNTNLTDGPYSFSTHLREFTTAMAWNCVRTLGPSYIATSAFARSPDPKA